MTSHHWGFQMRTEEEMFPKKDRLTVRERGEEHAEAAKSAVLVRPHPDHTHTIVQHDIIGYCAAELGLSGKSSTVHHSHMVLGQSLV